MPVPKRKRSRARRDSRHANKGIKAKIFTDCKNCQAVTMPHQVCRNCGYYKGVKVIATKVERALKRNEIAQARAKKSAKSQESAQPSQ